MLVLSYIHVRSLTDKSSGSFRRIEGIANLHFATNADLYHHFPVPARFFYATVPLGFDRLLLFIDTFPSYVMNRRISRTVKQ